MHLFECLYIHFLINVKFHLPSASQSKNTCLRSFSCRFDKLLWGEQLKRKRIYFDVLIQTNRFRLWMEGMAAGMEAGWSHCIAHQKHTERETRLGCKISITHFLYHGSLYWRDYNFQIQHYQLELKCSSTCVQWWAFCIQITTLNHEKFIAELGCKLSLVNHTSSW